MTIGLKVGDGVNNRGIVAGSILQGRIYLHNDQPANAHSIRLKISGIEEAVVHHTQTETRSTGSFHHDNNDNDTFTTDHYERHSDTFYKVDHTIKEFPGGVLPRGQYEFPFALQLPKSLPSSMEAGDSSQSYCSVRYEIVAEVYQKPNTIFYRNPHAIERLVVVAIPSTVTPQYDSSLHLPAEIVPISNCACCCFGGCTKIGTMALETKFDKTTLFLDAPSTTRATNNWNRSRFTQNRSFQSGGVNASQQSFGVQFRCENKSTEKVRHVKAQLDETIEWNVNGHRAAVTRTLATSTRDASLYPELDPMWHKPFAWEQHQYNNEARSPLLGAKPWRTIDPSLQVDGSQANDTYRGTAVRVRHVLTFKIVTGGCCSTNPDASAVVEIYRNPVAFGGPEAAVDPLAEVPPTVSPSAPFEDEIGFPPAASAPPSVYDTKPSEVPLAQAQVLPDNWDAQEAKVCHIPLAEATVVGMQGFP